MEGWCKEAPRLGIKTSLTIISVLVWPPIAETLHWDFLFPASNADLCSFYEVCPAPRRGTPHREDPGPWRWKDTLSGSECHWRWPPSICHSMREGTHPPTTNFDTMTLDGLWNPESPGKRGIFSRSVSQSCQTPKYMVSLARAFFVTQKFEGRSITQWRGKGHSSEHLSIKDFSIRSYCRLPPLLQEVMGAFAQTAVQHMLCSCKEEASRAHLSLLILVRLNKKYVLATLLQTRRADLKTISETPWQNMITSQPRWGWHATTMNIAIRVADRWAC